MKSILRMYPCDKCERGEEDAAHRHSTEQHPKQILLEADVTKNPNRPGSKASDAARVLIGRRAELLIIKRLPRQEVGAEYPEQRVLLTDAGGVSEQIKGLDTETLLVLSGRQFVFEAEEGYERTANLVRHSIAFA